MADGIIVSTILLVDDHILVRQAIAVLLSFYDDFEVVGQAGDGREALVACERLRPDLVLMDQWMPGMDGTEATRLLKASHPETLVVILTSDPSPSLADEAREAGADGHLYKLITDDVAAGVIRRVLAGEKVFEMSGVEVRKTGEKFPPLLSAREMEVLRMVSSGHTNRRISDELHVSLGTAKTYVQRILAKLSASSRTEAAVKAREFGLL